MTTPAHPEPQWDGIVRRSIDLEVRSINEEERSVEVVCSTKTIDAHGDVVDQKFDLTRYKKNPVVLWHHNRFGGFFGGTSAPKDFLPVGRAKGTKVERDAATGDRQLATKLIFGSKEYNELAEQVWLGFKEEIIRAVSIGFRPGKVTEKTDEHGHTYYELSDNELYEISVVPIPSNPDAVAKSIAFEHDQLRRLAAKDNAPGGAGDTDMDPKELQAELDKVKGALAVANADLDKTKTEAKAKADKDEARIKELEGLLEGQKTKCGELTDQVKTLSEANAKFQEAEKKATEEKAKAEAAADVDAVVGKKIAPAAREKWMAVRLRSKSEFDELLADMPELPHLKNIVPKDGSTPGSAGGAQSLIDEAKGA